MDILISSLGVMFICVWVGLIVAHSVYSLGRMESTDRKARRRGGDQVRLRTYIGSKLHHLTVTETQVNYVGSIFIDARLMDASGIQEYEQVHVLNVDNGHRWVTYAMRGNECEVSVRGPGARYAEVGDQLIVISYVMTDEAEWDSSNVHAVHVNPGNKSWSDMHGETQKEED